jgi:hypothetical protein
MVLEWLSGIKDITDIIASLSELIKSNIATKDLLIKELKLNITAFEIVQKDRKIDYDKLLLLLKNKQINKARQSKFIFSIIKKGKIENKHVKDIRNKKYIGKNCGWLFKNIDDKIDELRMTKQYHNTLTNMERKVVALQLSNLFFKMKLLAEFIK